MQQNEAIYYLAGKKFTCLVDSFIYRSPWQVSQKFTALNTELYGTCRADFLNTNQMYSFPHLENYFFDTV